MVVLVAADEHKRYSTATDSLDAYRTLAPGPENQVLRPIPAIGSMCVSAGQPTRAMDTTGRRPSVGYVEGMDELSEPATDRV